MTNAYLDLARRCEEASGPDRALDLDIAESVGHFFHYRRGSPRVVIKCAEYTASIDAAMFLVPEGWRVGSLRELIADEMVPGVNNGPWVVQLSERHERQGRKVVSCEVAATPALALCSASLRAKGAGE